MPDAIELIKTIKRAALDAVDASKPVQVCFGKVTNTSPLKILVEQKMTLGVAQLILSRNVTEHTVEMTVNHYTESETKHTHEVEDTYTGGGSSEPTSHLHAYRGRKTFTVHNGLVVGDEVVLLRQQGGQKYIVVDRIG